MLTAFVPILLITLLWNIMNMYQLLKRFKRTRNRTLAVAFLLMWLAAFFLLPPTYYLELFRSKEVVFFVHERSLFFRITPLIGDSYGFVNALILLILIRPFHQPFILAYKVVKNRVLFCPKQQQQPHLHTATSPPKTRQTLFSFASIHSLTATSARNF